MSPPRPRLRQRVQTSSFSVAYSTETWRPADKTPRTITANFADSTPSSRLQIGQSSNDHLTPPTSAKCVRRGVASPSIMSNGLRKICSQAFRYTKLPCSLIHPQREQLYTPALANAAAFLSARSSSVNGRPDLSTKSSSFIRPLRNSLPRVGPNTSS